MSDFAAAKPSSAHPSDALEEVATRAATNLFHAFKESGYGINSIEAHKQRFLDALKQVAPQRIAQIPSGVSADSDGEAEAL